jgi:hypothetical protein
VSVVTTSPTVTQVETLGQVTASRSFTVVLAMVWTVQCAPASEVSAAIARLMSRPFERTTVEPLTTQVRTAGQETPEGRLKPARATAADQVEPPSPVESPTDAAVVVVTDARPASVVQHAVPVRLSGSSSGPFPRWLQVAPSVVV